MGKRKRVFFGLKKLNNYGVYLIKIAIVEDQQTLAQQMGFVLKKEGYETNIYYNAEDFLQELNSSIDILLLDINLPKMNGDELFELLSTLNYTVQTIFISSHSDMTHISKAFKLGCEDYIKKPFELEELILRVNKVAKTLDKSLLNSNIIIFHDYHFDLKNLNVTYHNQVIQLSKKETAIMELFLANINNVINFDTLNYRIWDNDVHTNTITAAILRLKKKLELSNLENIRDVGYIFKE